VAGPGRPSDGGADRGAEFLMTVADAADVCTWLADEVNAAALSGVLLPEKPVGNKAASGPPTRR